MSRDTRPILIAGPTASGKSALALALAEKFGGVIINADSMQVYRELNILTARPSPEDESRAPHLLYGFVPAREAYSAGRFAVDVKDALQTAHRLGRRPILVGGTGLYFKVLLEGLSPIPPIEEALRVAWRQRAEDVGASELHAMLAGKDAEMASRLDPNDTQRIVRALEVLDATGRSLAAWQRTPGTPIVNPATAIKLVAMAERSELQARADLRFERMLTAGALAEAKSLGGLKLDGSLPAMRAIGVTPLIAAATGTIPIEEAVERCKSETRQYIKRQVTWINRNMVAWNTIYT